MEQNHSSDDPLQQYWSVIESLEVTITALKELIDEDEETSLDIANTMTDVFGPSKRKDAIHSKFSQAISFLRTAMQERESINFQDLHSLKNELEQLVTKKKIGYDTIEYLLERLGILVTKIFITQITQEVREELAQQLSLVKIREYGDDEEEDEEEGISIAFENDPTTEIEYAIREKFVCIFWDNDNNEIDGLDDLL